MCGLNDLDEVNPNLPTGVMMMMAKLSWVMTGMVNTTSLPWVNVGVEKD